MENGMQVELNNGERYFIGDYSINGDGSAAYDGGCGCCSDGIYINEIVKYRRFAEDRLP